jgi:hypothetical protein
MHLDMIKPLSPSCGSLVVKRNNFPAEATPEVDLAIWVNMAVLDPRSDIVLGNVMSSG